MNAADFGSFYKAIHGYDPFPWQERLAGLVTQDGVWPDVLELPTASGKTSVLDIAVFHLALQAGEPVRTAPLRMFFIVDRRLVVDEAEEHAFQIKKAVQDATGGILAEVRNRLLQFGAAGPLDVVKLRGGMYRDNTLADEPNQPLICLSTVDQVGSRLLFRGYQVGRRQQSVHAGLVGCDSLLIIDEAHLSAPFLETVKALERYDTSHAVAPGPKVVRMSATAGAGSSFGLSELDTGNDVLMRRLQAVKKATLRPAAKFEKEAVEAACVALAEPPPLDLTLRNAAETADWAARLEGESLSPGHVRVARGRPVAELPGYGEGAWWVQNIAAAIPARLLGVGDGRAALDLCAAPGGKTMQLASAGWEVTAVDRDRARLVRLEDNLSRTKLAAKVVQADLFKWQPTAPVPAILLDAPCTATGIFARHPDVLHRVRDRDIVSLAGIG